MAMIFFFAETPDGWAVPGVHGPLQGDQLDGGIQSGVYLIRGRDANLLFDTGNWTLPEFGKGMADFLIEHLDRERNPLRYIFLSHYHFDHIGNASILKERYGAEVICHPLDRPLIESPLFAVEADNLLRFGVQPGSYLTDFNLDPGERIAHSDRAVIEKYWNRPVEVDRLVEDEDVIEVGGLALRVIHLPGHTPGHIGLWNPETRTLYSSDLMVFPAPITPFPFGNAKDNATSIQRCLDLKPECLFEGHGLSAYTQGSSERRLLHMQIQQRDTERRIMEVLRRVSEPQTIGQLLPEVMPIKFEYDYPVWSGVRHRRSFCEASIQTHLLWLIERREVRRVFHDGKVAFEAL
jgi:glyoxylase-like metal-dependent hydrolase (beta-lactamase superfamily II)